MNSAGIDKIRVMLVDDSVVVRHVLRDTLSKDPQIEVVAVAQDGDVALSVLDTANPDVVILDIEMPNRNGLDTLPELKKRRPETAVVMFSTLTARGATATLDALVAGADDYATKPSNTGSMVGAVETINADLVPKIKALASKKQLLRTRTPVASVPAADRAVSGRSGTVDLVVIASSTGGPNALAQLLPQLPADLEVPVLIVQHIPPVFSKALADRLHVKSPLEVGEAHNGAELRAGQAWIAPGDFHMTVERQGPNKSILKLDQEAKENSCRPAADVLFRSAAQSHGPGVLAVVLTGMGQDGMLGAREIVGRGGQCIAQDENTSVVWNMPGAVVDADLTNEILPLGRIAATIVSRVRKKSRMTTSFTN